MKRYIAVQDNKDRRIFIDYEDTMLRTFETVLATKLNKASLTSKYPNANDVTGEEIIVQKPL